jgi:hypothetical protein
VRWLCLVGLLAGCAFQVDGVGVPGIGSGGDPQPPSLTPAPSAPDLSDPSPITPVPPSSQPDASAPPDGSSPPLAIDIGNACGPPKGGCATGESCLTKIGVVNVPGGYCTIGCDSTPCPTGAQCAGNDGSKLCLEECPAAGCRPGYVCCTNNFAAPGVCTLAQFCM